MLDNVPIQVAEHSRELNYLFALSAVGVSGVTSGWSHYTGELLSSPSSIVKIPCLLMFCCLSGGGPFWLAMEGRTYHRVFSTDSNQYEHPAQWLLYDASGRSRAASSRNVPLQYVNALQDDLLEFNSLYRVYRNFAQYEPQYEDAYLELSDPGNGEEIAALYHTGNAPFATARSVYVQRAQDAAPSYIPILNPLYEPLQYPLLFPHGTAGWGERMRSALQWTQREYYKARLLTEPRFQIFSRLGCEYICDMFSRMEDERLEYIRQGKRQESLDFPPETERDDDDETTEAFSLPASFTGSHRFLSNKVADSLALARQRGKPDFMVTATCNPNWPEILSQLRPGQSACEVPQITNRVFKVVLYLRLMP